MPDKKDKLSTKELSALRKLLAGTAAESSQMRQQFDPVLGENPQQLPPEMLEPDFVKHLQTLMASSGRVSGQQPIGYQRGTSNAGDRIRTMFTGWNAGEMNRAANYFANRAFGPRDIHTNMWKPGTNVWYKGEGPYTVGEGSWKQVGNVAKRLANTVEFRDWDKGDWAQRRDFSLNPPAGTPAPGWFQRVGGVPAMGGGGGGGEGGGAGGGGGGFGDFGLMGLGGGSTSGQGGAGDLYGVGIGGGPIEWQGVQSIAGGSSGTIPLRLFQAGTSRVLPDQSQVPDWARGGAALPPGLARLQAAGQGPFRPGGPMSTDTVDAKLTVGEGVLNTGAMSMPGMRPAVDAANAAGARQAARLPSWANSLAGGPIQPVAPFPAIPAPVLSAPLAMAAPRLTNIMYPRNK
jgi:hypothetical protein